MTRPKSIILKPGNGCETNNTMIVKLTDYQGNYIGLLHISSQSLQQQFRAKNIDKIALIRKQEFITPTNSVNSKGN